MASIRAIKTGLWSDPTVWNTNTIPAINDDVYSNGFVVTINQNIVVNRLTNKSGSGISAGGRFLVSSNRSITVTNFDPTDTSTRGLVDITANCSLTINGQIKSSTGAGHGVFISTSGVTSVSLTTTSILAVGGGSRAVYSKTGNLVLTVQGNITAGTTVNSCAVVVETGTLSLNSTGGLFGKGDNSYAVRVINGDTTLSATGEIKAGTGIESHAIKIDQGNLTLSLATNITAGDALNAHAISALNGSCTITINGTIKGGIGDQACGLYVTSGSVTCTIGTNIQGGSGSDACGIIALDGNIAVNDAASVTGGSGDSAHAVCSNVGDVLVISDYIVGGSGDHACGVVLGVGTLSVEANSITGGSGSEATGVLSIDNSLKTRVVKTINAGATTTSAAVKTSYKTDKVELSGGASYATNGNSPLQVPILLVVSGSVSMTTRSTTNTAITLSQAGGAVPGGSLPVPADVRKGVVYGGTQTGTLVIPNPNQVSFGVPVDGTFGQAALILPEVVNLFGEQIRAAFNLEGGIVYVTSTVYHGAIASTPRPENSGPTIWVGSVEPLNALNGDVWVNE